ncbi:MAG: hypothetical protein GY851_32770, partial [bacterium]|nr:hypothetical protein [bacterium]
DLFNKNHGRWPRDLQEACDSGDLAFTPPHPYADGAWHYDPATGDIEG